MDEKKPIAPSRTPVRECPDEPFKGGYQPPPVQDVSKPPPTPPPPPKKE